MKRLFLFPIFIFFLLPVILQAAPPTEANRFFIVNPSDSTVGIPVTVTIEARRGNNVDTNYQNDVTLVASGSATGGGVVDIVNGIGARDINDSVAGTITISLSDTQSTGLDVSSTRQVTFSAPAGGGDGGTPAWNQQKFLFRDDDGDEVAASGFGTENVNQNVNIINVVSGATFRLRFAVKLTQADVGGIAPQVEFKEGADCTTGSWTVAASASSVFNLQLSQNFTDGAATTQQISSGPNFVAGQIFESTNSAVSLSMLKNQSTEYEWSLRAADNINLGTTYSFRITNNGTAFNSYDQCPSLTTQSPPPPPSPSLPSGVGARSGAVRPTTVAFSGRAFPGAKVLVVDKDVRSEQIASQDVVAAEDGNFHISFIGILQSQHSFWLVVKDKEGRATQTKFFNIDTLANDLVVKDILVSPTVGLLERLVTRGRNVTVTGYASPGSNVLVEIDGTIKKEAKADKDGVYKIGVETGPLEFSPHRIRAKQIDLTQKRESDFSPTQVFVVSKLVSPRADLSGDGRVDIKDWGIFLAKWVSKEESQKNLIDLNVDGKVDFSDFGIFIRSIKSR